MVSPPFLSCFLYLQVTRTCINSRTNSNFGQIGPLCTKLAALERLKNSHRLTMEKWCLHAGAFIFNRIIIKAAGNQDRHKNSVEFDFGPNQTTHFGVISHWATWFNYRGGRLFFSTWKSSWGAYWRPETTFLLQNFVIKRPLFPIRFAIHVRTCNLMDSKFWWWKNFNGLFYRFAFHFQNSSVS